MSLLASQIEAILYLKGQPLDLAFIAECAGCDRDTAEMAILDLINEYAHRETALEIVETPKGYTLQLRGEFQDLIEKMIPPEIGMGALRTLAAIAIKGSISQSELVELRGSGAYQHVQELVEVGFVRKRRQSGSRSSLLQVTDKFHRTYELKDLPEFKLVKTQLESAEQLELGVVNLADEDDKEADLEPVEAIGGENVDLPTAAD